MNQSFFKARNTNNAVLTLFEKDNAEAGALYDVFDGTFCLKEGQTTAQYTIRLCLINPSDAVIESKVIDGNGNVICNNPTYIGVSSAVHICGGKDENVAYGMSLFVRVTYKVGGAEQSPELTIPLTGVLPEGSHTFTHPTKRKTGEAVRRFGDKPSSGPLLYSLKPEPDYVVTVLDRDPRDTADVDYICHWGNKAGSYYPYFGLPGQGEVTGPQNGRFLADKA
jgi:hypothetical protein